MGSKVKFNPGPDAEALRFFRARGLKPSFDWRDVYGAEHAYSFTVAKVTQLDLLRSIRDSLDEALEAGGTFAQWKKNITPVLRSAGWIGKGELIDPLTGEIVQAELGTPHRLNKIFNTNMRQARHAGQWERIQGAKEDFPFLQYRIGPAEAHREEHVAWDGMILPVTDSWWDTHTPMNGWNCHCWVKQLTRAQAERTGISAAPPIEERSMVNKRTGEVIKVPRGIDPGFEFNVGRERVKSADAFTNTVFSEARPEYARAAIGDFVADPNMIDVMTNTERALPVGYAPQDLMDIAGVRNPLTLMSAKVAKKQIRNHPELPAVHYSKIPEIMETADEIRLNEKNGAYHLLRSVPGKPTEIVILIPSSDGEKFFLKTTYLANKKETARQQKLTRLIRKR